MSLSSTQIESIARQVYGQFPDVKGVRPSVQGQSPKTPNARTQFVLTFKGSAQAGSGRTIQRIVRVVADERGNVVKMSTSR
ncbi:MAG: hypothetical protein ACT4QE_00890 [Anaerolineales bacterium]